jgi:hypothetical protein
MLASLLAAAVALCSATAAALAKSARRAGKDAPAADEASECSRGEFIAGQINSHLKAIALYENEACSADARRRATAQRILPQLHRHLAMLESLQSADGHDPADGRHRDARAGRRS